MLTTARKAFKVIGRDHRGRWWLLILLAVLVSGLEMVGAVAVYLLLELVINPTGAIDLPVIGDLRARVTEANEDRLLLLVIGSMGLFFVVRAVIKVGAKYAQYRVAHHAGARLSNRLMKGYLRWPYVVHLQRNSSELIRNAYQAVDALVAGIFIPMIKVIAESLIMVGMLVVLLTIAPVATLLAVLIIGGSSVLLLFVVQPRLKRIGRTAHELSQQAIQFLQQALQGIRDIKILGREDYFARQFARNRLRFARARYMRATLIALPTVTIETALIGFILVFFALAVVAGAESQSVLSVLGLFAYAGLRLQPSLQQIISGMNDIRHAAAPLDDLHADLIAVEEDLAVSTEVNPLAFVDTIRLENVSFSYEASDRPALMGVDLTIHAGEQVGICGPTGGGKTTLVDIITGLLEPSGGRVTVDGIDLKGNAKGWHRHLGVVPQVVFLIDDTLRNNIALGIAEEEIDEAALAEAIELAQLSEFVGLLPKGLETTVGERGVRLSGGQRQRIAIARAMYRRPSVLVLDEGTSALDNATEADFMEAVERLRGERTIILIAHRLSSVRDSDKVVLVESGRIAGVDTFEALARNNERFKALAASH